MLTRHHILGSHGHISGLSGKIGTSVLVVGTADVHAFQKYCEVLLRSVVIVQAHIQGLSERMAKVKRFLWALNFTKS